MNDKSNASLLATIGVHWGTDGPTADIADVWWHRWSLGPLPMIRATVRPRARVKAVNQALVNHLGFSMQDTPSIIQSVLSALQSYNEATAESIGLTPGPRLMALSMPRHDGSTLSLKMLLVAHSGRLAEEIAVVGVGIPTSSTSNSNRTIPRVSHEVTS